MPLEQRQAAGPPSALAGAMMKDKKPFTYTPGGLDLSEINAGNHPQQNGTANGGADFAPPIQSRAFRVLQNVLDTQDTAEPQGPVHIPSINPHLQNSHQFQHQPTPQHFQQPSPQHFQQPTPQHFQQPDSVGVSGVAEAPPEPKKYMGGNIPSRSFRMLQAMTADDDDVAGPGQSDL